MAAVGCPTEVAQTQLGRVFETNESEVVNQGGQDVRDAGSSGEPISTQFVLKNLLTVKWLFHNQIHRNTESNVFSGVASICSVSVR